MINGVSIKFWQLMKKRCHLYDGTVRGDKCVYSSMPVRAGMPFLK